MDGGPPSDPRRPSEGSDILSLRPRLPRGEGIAKDGVVVSGKDFFFFFWKCITKEAAMSWLSAPRFSINDNTGNWTKKLQFPLSWISLLEFIIFLYIIIHLPLHVVVMQGLLQFSRLLRSCEMGENNLAKSPWLSCPLLAGLCLFYTRLFYILSPQASREWWGYMVPSAPTDWLIAQTERESGRGRWRKSTRERAGRHG